ncbi:AAA family ATPase [Alkalihalobacterium alkalinitrilicum]|uniref:AAA family ATPase n=1 Tax=Alkalihalobacterium alkalinitrilicum TaxID=427920 RepID=UPI000994D3EE|nr:AAA family ATPase [Alkalihalobacterium alkalinitrilicum]
MNWIKEVRLENFQSHLDTTISFINGLNVIVGQSDSGKTSILRGIRWVLFNQPRGTDFMRVSGDFVRVTLTFANECSIVRERTTSRNRYIIMALGKEDLVLEGFGIHVPQEVLDAHQIYPLRIDRDMEILLNVSQQLDGPFLLDQTASVRAKTIGRISGAHYIDMAVRDTTKDVAKLQQQTRHVETEAEILKEKIAPYQFLDKAKEQLDIIEQQFKLIKEKDAKLSRLESVKKHWKDLAGEKEKVENRLTILKEVDDWERILERLQFLSEKRRLFQLKYTQMNENQKAIKTCKHWILKTDSVDTAMKNAVAIERKFDRINKLIQLKQLQVRLHRSLIDVSTIMNKTSFATNSEEQKVQELLRKVKSANELRSFQQHYDTLNLQIKSLQKRVEGLQRIKNSEEKHRELHSELQQLGTYKRSLEKYREVKRRLRDGVTFIAEKQQEEHQLKRQYEQLLLQKGNCPTCGGQLSSSVIKQLLT